MSDTDCNRRTKKYKKVQSLECYPDKQVYLQRENIETLIPKVNQLADKYGEEEEIDFEKWFNSPYHPTPTIIAAAVEAWMMSHAGKKWQNSMQNGAKSFTMYLFRFSESGIQEGNYKVEP